MRLHTQLRIPGLGVIRPDHPAAHALVLNLVFLFGMFVFAILVGLISEWGVGGGDTMAAWLDT